jgi:hypothetical protein
MKKIDYSKIKTVRDAETAVFALLLHERGNNAVDAFLAEFKAQNTPRINVMLLKNKLDRVSVYGRRFLIEEPATTAASKKKGNGKGNGNGNGNAGNGNGNAGNGNGNAGNGNGNAGKVQV